MLQHQESEENIPLTDHRVTTEEFTQAVAAVEARKEEEKQRLAETVPIAQTAQELGLEATPDEIWAEVQAQRARQAAAQAAPPQNQAPEQQIPVSNYLPFRSLYRQRPHRQRRYRWFPILLAVIFFTRFFSPHHTSVTVGHGTPSAPVSASIKTLAETPNGEPVYCSNSMLIELQGGRPLSKILVSKEYHDNDWDVIKYDGHVYLHGYTLSLSDQAMQAQPVTLYEVNVVPGFSTPITIRLDKNKYRVITEGRGDINNNTIMVSHPHLDSHAHETWSSYP